MPVLVLAIFLFLTPAIADKDVYKICRAGGEVRTLRIWTKKDGNCVTVYTKTGEDRERATAKQFDVCLQVLTNIEKNLLDNKWKCRDLNPGQYKVTSGNE
ncbi:MAG: hypothetical protein K2X47_13125 [Bdellovibrionales bacterium]|nr:hypothetical protein [Bdellovibrionales bacterium]